MLYFRKNAPFQHLQQSVQLIYKSCGSLKEWSCLPWGPVLFLPMLWQHNPGLSCQGERRSQVVQSLLDKEVPSQTKVLLVWFILKVYFLQMECCRIMVSITHTCLGCLHVLSEALLFALCLMCTPFMWKEEIERREPLKARCGLGSL